MLTIGQFAKLSKMSIYQLRNYDKLGLLKPCYIDEKTHYRYYDEELLPQACQIQALKTMGFSLESIQDILKKYTVKGDLKQYLMELLEEKEEEVQTLQKKIKLIRTVIKALENDMSQIYSKICIKELPKRKVVSYTGVIHQYSDQKELWATFLKKCERAKVQYSRPHHNIAVFKVMTHLKEGQIVELQQSVEGEYVASDELQYKEEEAILVASVTYEGSYEQVGAINQMIEKWVRDNGYHLKGSSLHIYHRSPLSAEDMNHLITEICLPIQR